MVNELNSYIKSLKGVIVYPFLSFSGAVFILVTGILFTTALTLPRFGRRDPSIYVLVIAGFVVSTYLYQIVESTVSGNERRPPKIDYEFLEEMGPNLFHYMGGIVISYLPSLVLIVYAGIDHQGLFEVPAFIGLIVLLIILGTIYFPMALLLNGFTQRWNTAFNFSVGFRGIGRMGKDYIICSMIFMLSVGIWIYMWVFLVAETERGWNKPRIISVALTSTVGMYLFMIKMHALGILYRKHYDNLGWSLGDEG